MQTALTTFDKENPNVLFCDMRNVSYESIYEGGNRFSRYIEGEKIYATVYPTYEERLASVDSAIDDLIIAITPTEG